MSGKLRFKFDFMVIPPEMYYKNCRSLFTVETWSRIRFKVYEIDNYICQCCGMPTNKPHAHEHFKMRLMCYYLADIVTLCPTCHAAVHIKRSEDMIEVNKLKEHLIKNKILTLKQYKAKREIHKNAVALTYRRLISYKLSLNYVVKFALKHELKMNIEANPDKYKIPLSKKYAKYVTYIPRNGASLFIN